MIASVDGLARPRPSRSAIDCHVSPGRAVYVLMRGREAWRACQNAGSIGSTGLSVRSERPSSGVTRILSRACAPWRSSSRVHTPPLDGERTVERSEEECDEPRARARAHQAYAPDFSRERAQARTYFDSKFIEQVPAHAGFIGAFRNPDRVESPQPFALRCEQR